MNLKQASITDIVRSSQRDELFVNEFQDYIVPILNFFGNKTFHHARKYVHPISTTWYYLLTTLGNLQTLGEEYTGTVRIKNRNIPSKITSIIWLALFVGGETLFSKVIEIVRKRICDSTDLTENAKVTCIRYIDFIKENKHIIIRIHHSIFYINGRYQNISNRLTGVRYTLVRNWMKDDSPSRSLKFLGQTTIFYLTLNLLQKAWTQKNSTFTPIISQELNTSKKMCILCVDNRQNTSITPCGHLFCWECIFDSLRHQPYCPICREPVNSSRIVFLQNYC